MSSQQTLLTSPTAGRYLFDAVFSIDHSLNVTITQHPVQSGAAVADHAFLEPEEVVIDIGMTDVATSIDTIAGTAKNRSVVAFEVLRSILQARELLTLTTRLGSYTDMMVTTIAVHDDVNTMNALRANISLQKVRIVQVAIISIQQTCSSSKITYASAEDSSGGYSSGSVTSSGGTTQVDIPSSGSYTGSTNSGSTKPSTGSGSSGSNSSVLNDIWNKITGK